MTVSVSRLAFAALSAVAAAAVLTTPAGAAAYGNEISVRKDAHINPDDTITLFGTYRCAPTSPVGSVQVSVTVIQDGTRLTFAGDEAARCDGERHDWTASGGLRMTPGFHPGAAGAEVRLQRAGVSGSGLVPTSVHVSHLAESRQDIEVYG
ncbi:DUF6299 family protein [Streptomyces sp. RerS4]|uniref:DUF6299 family protein n=1 Tax=Streptomyces sp. RerS4 TaxID=2942449 RepID=UPI00201C90AE|nr:DUF6299 family protein [Streptomyces sp. RerS4]UQX01545.1 DUF6299 family protein [Streptomyces sp. RerS4]